MKNRLFRLVRLAAAIALGAAFTSCATTYDAYGQPRQTVDPGLAIAGVAAAGVIGYALGNSNNNHYYHGPPHRGGYGHYNVGYGGGCGY